MNFILIRECEGSGHLPCDKIIGAVDTALVTWKDGEKPEAQFYCRKKYVAAEETLDQQCST